MARKITKIEPVSKQYQAEEQPLKRVCAYCRVSTDSREQKSSYESQLNYYSNYIQEKEGWVYAGIYADEARSGTKILRRDNFLQMMSDCRLGKLDMIITKSITRFARNTVDSIEAIRELAALGVAVYFEKERINTLSEKSEQLITILSSLAQGESENISTNTKWSVIRRFREGTFITPTPAYGYKNDEYGELVIHEEEAVIVRRIFDEYLGGKGAYAIAKGLQRDSIPTIKGGKTWNESTVRGFLVNPVYEGDLLLQKTYSMDAVPFVRKKNNGEQPQYLVAENHEPIISRSEAGAVHQIFEFRRQKIRSDEADYQIRYPFSGKIKCGVCGTHFRRQKLFSKNGYVKIQWCCKQHIFNKTLCDQKAIMEELIKTAFIQMWNRLVSNYENILLPMLAALKMVRCNPEQEREFIELEQNIQELKKQNHMLSKILTEGGMDSALFIQKKNEIDYQLEAAWHKQRLLHEQNVFEREISQTEYLITIFRSRPMIIESFDDELFLLTIEEITAFPDGNLEFCLKNGLQLCESFRREA